MLAGPDAVSAFREVCQPVERALQDVDRGMFVDHQGRRARLMSYRLIRAPRRRWRAARPQGDGQIGEFRKIAREGRVDCARVPRLASMLMGRPARSPPRCARRRWRGGAPHLILKACAGWFRTPVASLRSGSDTATPWSCANRGRQCAALRPVAVASIRGKINAMARIPRWPAMGCKVGR